LKYRPYFTEAQSMGLARDLTMGQKRPRAPRAGSTPEYTALKRFTAMPEPDLTVFRAALERVGGQRTRMRFAEGVIYAEACARYRELSGEDYGPVIGTY
jgi:hypothetical protein